MIVVWAERVICLYCLYRASGGVIGFEGRVIDNRLCILACDTVWSNMESFNP